MPSYNNLLDIVIKSEVHEIFRTVNTVLLSILPYITLIGFRIFFRNLSIML
jgi:hypothetical protein